MIEIKGKYNTAKVFTDQIEEGAIEQIRTLCDMEFVRDSKIRIMPDVHEGAGCTIGTTMTITDKVVPNLVGVDIGCGMETACIRNKHLELSKLDKLIYQTIPSGFHIRDIPHRYTKEIDLTLLKCHRNLNLDRAVRSLGTLGGGNHFIEVNQDDTGALYVVVHSGSRHIGLETAKYYQHAGCEQLAERGTSGGHGFIPNSLAYVSGELFRDYIHDMKIIQQYAALNRKAMMDEIIKGMKLDVESQFTTTHNYIDTEDMILRKGAVSAKKGEKLLIPINMRDGSLLCTGRGNEDWNFSAPHGAGRLMSRKEARSTFTVSEFRKQMKDVFTTSVRPDTLDECPMAYKTMQEIIRYIGPTAEIDKIIRPIYNFKVGEEDC